MRQAGVRPVTLAVAPVSATTPSHHGNWPYDWVVSTSGPTLEKRRSRRREPNLRQLGTVAGQGKALGVEAGTNRGADITHRMQRHLCDPTRLRAEQRRLHTHPVPRGGFHKAGEGPAFGDSFPNFSSLRNWAQRSVPAKMGTFS